MGLTTLVLGASDNPERYAYKAIVELLKHGYQVIGVGNRSGTVKHLEISTNWPEPNSVDTVTLYLGKKHQEGLLDQIKKLNPRRVIFNPGTENEVLQSELESSGIQSEVACTLVLLATNQYES